jgi:hypothetical protein
VSLPCSGLAVKTSVAVAYRSELGRDPDSERLDIYLCQLKGGLGESLLLRS